MAARQFGAKREARRVARRVIDLECAVYSELWGEAIDHRVTDLSEDGLWIQTELLLEVGAEVTLTFNPPDWEEPLFVAGRVQRVELQRKPGDRDAVGMGIEFEALRADERRRLTRSMRGLPARESFILDKHTLTGVPVGVADAPEAVEHAQSVAKTIVGWASPPSTEAQAADRPASQRDASVDEPPHSELPKGGFAGGLDLATSVFAACRSD